MSKQCFCMQLAEVTVFTKSVFCDFVTSVFNINIAELSKSKQFLKTSFSLSKMFLIFKYDVLHFRKKLMDFLHIHS